MVINRSRTSKIDLKYFFFTRYNNEWMIIDYKLYTPGQDLKDNLLIVLEQIPGYIEWSDKTDVLRKQSYWTSYNLP
jgi:hypothetical protein